MASQHDELDTTVNELDELDTTTIQYEDIDTILEKLDEKSFLRISETDVRLLPDQTDSDFCYTTHKDM